MTMQTILVLAATAILGQPALAADVNFRCENHMFRDAALDISPGNELMIADSHVEGSVELNQHFQDKLGKEAHLMISRQVLSIPIQSVNCREAMPYLLECNAGPINNAHIAVSGFINVGGTGGTITLHDLIKLNKFVLKTNLSSSGGPIAIGTEPTTVQINRMIVNATAEFEIDGKSFVLTFKPFFHTGKKSQGKMAFCERR